MLLVWAVSCDSYELHEDGTADIFGAGFDTFRVESLPIELEIQILLRLILLEDERDEIDVLVLGPGLALLHEGTFEIEATPGTNHRPGYDVNQIEPLRLAFIAETEGVHSVEIYAGGKRDETLSDERRRTLFFNVREGLPE